MPARSGVGHDGSARMKVAILSDIHDRTENLRQALERCRGADVLICCGDLCSPFVLRDLCEGFAGPVHVVFGNNDGDLFRMAGVATGFPHVTLHGEYCELDIDGATFAVNHFDTIGRAIARGGSFDVVCFGHNHRFEITPSGKTLAINPGEIYGGRTGSATFVIYDTGTRKAERIDLRS
jgi:putative phosphoesterase